jgi:hypothetical protein
MKTLLGLVIFILLLGIQGRAPMAWASTGQALGDTLAHTQVEQGQAALKPIASLKLGDMVLAKSKWKAQEESLSYEPIIDIMVTPAQPRRLVDLVLADGQTITTTDGHPLMALEGWRDAILFKKGGKLLLKGDGESEKTAEIASVTHRLDTQTTYNLEVANAHTFFVGVEGVLVHNGVRPPNLTPPGGGRKGAFREAKRNCDIPMCQQPDAVGPSRDRKGRRLAGRTYTFGDCEIREHADGHDFPDDPSQNRGPHFNDPKEGHYDY